MAGRTAVMDTAIWYRVSLGICPSQVAGFRRCLRQIWAAAPLRRPGRSFADVDRVDAFRLGGDWALAAG